MKKWGIMAAIVLVIAISLYKVTDRTTHNKKDIVSSPSDKATNTQLSTVQSDERGVATSQTGKKGKKASSALEVAEEFLRLNREKLGIKDYHQMKPTERRTPLVTTIKYSFEQDGIPIIGMDLQIRVSHKMDVESIRNNYRPLERVDLAQETVLSPEALIQAVSSNKFSVVDGKTKDLNFLFYVQPNQNRPELAYPLRVKANERGKPVFLQALFRASDGKMLTATRPR